MARSDDRTPQRDGRTLKARSLLSARQWQSISLALSLSQREFDVVQGVFDGRNEVSIAEKLGISAHTVHTHLDRLYRKLGVTTRSELILRIFAQYVTMNRPGRVGASLRASRSRKPERIPQKRLVRKA